MASSQYLFYVVRSGTKKRMTEDNARKMMHIYGVEARKSCIEVPENVHPHLWRHSRAMHLYRHGMPLVEISQWLGHANLETTLIYAHADTEHKRRAIECSTPDGSPLKKHLDSERFQIDDVDTLKRLWGLR
jgi:site-specific recombinase XerD